VIVLEDSTVVGIDVCYAGTAAAGKSLIEDKKWGRGTPSDRSAAMAARAQTMETVADALKRGDITAREAQKARYDIALKVKSSYHPGCVRPPGAIILKRKIMRMRRRRRFPLRLPQLLRWMAQPSGGGDAQGGAHRRQRADPLA